jgi:hypothetical protein
MKGWLKSKKFWVGAVAGYLGGSWAISTAKGITRKV